MNNTKTEEIMDKLLGEVEEAKDVSGRHHAIQRYDAFIKAAQARESFRQERASKVLVELAGKLKSALGADYAKVEKEVNRAVGDGIGVL